MAPKKKYEVPRRVEGAPVPPTKQPRKPRAPPPRLEGFTDGEWLADQQRRSVSTTDRRNRLFTQKSRELQEAAAKKLEETEAAAAAAKRELQETLAQAVAAKEAIARRRLFAPAG